MAAIDRDAGEPYYTFKRMHEDFYNRLMTDARLAREYKIDTWGEGRFDWHHLPPTGIHAKYQRVYAEPIEESTSFYTYRVCVIIWVLINVYDVSKQYDLAELYLSRITQIFTEKPDDWALDGTVTDIKYGRADYAQDWNERGQSIMLCSATFYIYADIERMHTQST